MITEAKNLAIVIEFEPHDWKNGLARHMLSGIKQLPYNARRYNDTDKTWHITPTQKNRQLLLECYNDWELNQPYSWDSAEDEPEINAFLEQFN